ncbi:multiple monosaccharide ABC transporter permease [Roseateles paludis]|uniref:Xylose transport system permease protein XylH n=1 Tax=Roseateles paludis TaxID=3145238 RepID=A0ABV0G2R6_9BURK
MNATTTPSSAWAHLSSQLRQYGMLMSLLVIMGLFQHLTEGTLLQPVNLTNLILQNSYIVIMALGMLLVIVVGHIDLSVGSVAGFVGALGAVLMVEHEWHWASATAVCLVAGGVIGAMQGAFVAWLRIPSFIVTLAGMLVFKGLALWLLSGQSLGPFPPEFQAMASGFFPGPDSEANPRQVSLLIAAVVVLLAVGLAWRDRASARQHGIVVEPLALWLGRLVLFCGLGLGLVWLLGGYKGLPVVLLMMAVLTAVYAFVTQRMVVGRRLYALGGNEKAARLSGVQTERLVFASFVNLGVLTALAGLIFAARLNTATPKAGLGMELDVIAACFIGGASASGGVGRVGGAVIGAFVMGVMNNGMSLLGIGIDVQQVIKGLVLLAAVCFDVLQRRRG